MAKRYRYPVAARSLSTENKSRIKGQSSPEPLPVLLDLYSALLAHYGPQGWWPGDTDLEIVVGAVLTQNTAWTLVERAIASLKSAGMLSLEALSALDESRLAEMIRPAGTHRVKARRLKAVIEWLRHRHPSDVRAALAGQVENVREELLAVHGVGPETADAILLYAGRRLTYVIDAYKRRIWRRHGLISGPEPYERLRQSVQAELPHDVTLYQEFHALLVAVGKQHCRARARCEGCPLAHFPHDAEA